MNRPAHEHLMDLLARARDLAADLERLSSETPNAPHTLRIAAAHALGLVDQLENASRGAFGAAPNGGGARGSASCESRP